MLFFVYMMLFFIYQEGGKREVRSEKRGSHGGTGEHSAHGEKKGGGSVNFTESVVMLGAFILAR